MKCPKCKKEGCKYIEKKVAVKKGNAWVMIPRKDSRAKCNCGWEGELR